MMPKLPEILFAGKIIRSLAGVMLGCSLISSASFAATPEFPEHEFKEQKQLRDLSAFKRPEYIPFPADNPYTLAKATLGKMLFFEPRLSRDRNISCASCHNPSFGWEVPFAHAIGAGGKPLARHSPTTINLAWTSSFFWDGRAASLEDQARGPIESEVEMDLPLAKGAERLRKVKGYVQAFKRAFPNEGLTEQTILKSLATFERTIVTGETRFDQWVAGDADALTAAEQRGFALFDGKAGCSQCHSGWNFTDNEYHDIGLATEDTGRAAVTGSDQDSFRFKTPGLREIGARAPYMHNGSLTALEVVVAHYMSGGIPRPSRSEKIKPRPLTSTEVEELVSFLKTLQGKQATMAMPNLPAQ